MPLKPTLKPAAKKTSAAAAPAASPVAAKNGFPARKDGAPAKAKKKVKANPIPTFSAPSDFKPAFFEIKMVVGADGLPNANGFFASRVKGRWDNPENKRFNLREYDVTTYANLLARFSAVAFAPNPAKRLKPDAKFLIILRALQTSEGDLRARVVNISEKVGKSLKMFEDKSDPVYRKIRKVSRHLAGAFIDVQLPPSARRVKKDEGEDEGE